MKVTDDMITRELEITERDIEMQKYVTQLKKSQFIDEIKYGLGKEIKENPNKITIIKKPWYQKLKLFLSKIFTRF
jgi:hypothetical protein